ncbi:MAG TPA: nitroreductase, partial [Micavibrio sp.]
PSPVQVEVILNAAARVPDHGKLAPWRFIVFSGDARRKAGEALRKSWLSAEPDAAPAKLDLESERFMRAPTVIAVVSSVKDGKTPEWEQILSAGAACFNLCLAANALGFSTVWLTEWYSYNETFRNAIGLNDRERFAGFIYIGTGTEPPQERDRPAMKDIVRYM